VAKINDKKGQFQGGDILHSRGSEQKGKSNYKNNAAKVEGVASHLVRAKAARQRWEATSFLMRSS
jgi:hypothetical protein